MRESLTSVTEILLIDRGSCFRLYRVQCPNPFYRATMSFSLTNVFHIFLCTAEAWPTLGPLLERVSGHLQASCVACTSSFLPSVPLDAALAAAFGLWSEHVSRGSK